jgi:hypothetical protein
MGTKVSGYLSPPSAVKFLSEAPWSSMILVVIGSDGHRVYLRRANRTRMGGKESSATGGQHASDGLESDSAYEAGPQQNEYVWQFT